MYVVRCLQFPTREFTSAFMSGERREGILNAPGTIPAAKEHEHNENLDGVVRFYLRWKALCRWRSRTRCRRNLFKRENV